MAAGPEQEDRTLDERQVPAIPPQLVQDFVKAREHYYAALNDVREQVPGGWTGHSPISDDDRQKLHSLWDSGESMMRAGKLLTESRKRLDSERGDPGTDL